ncbi:hypothetical protein P4576_17015 [Peribacillus frigoritolerans]|uniref:hypothetical protein n=1 Tax=Peribacillus frigoritolerans TaxID=450367 RepID=UPI002E1AFC36|nr:hypothetical protein [Peribacillus frigoritolerans]
MKPEILSTAIETLTDLFFRKNNGTDFLALRTTELYINLDLLGDTNAVADELNVSVPLLSFLSYVYSITRVLMKLKLCFIGVVIPKLKSLQVKKFLRNVNESNCKFSLQFKRRNCHVGKILVATTALIVYSNCAVCDIHVFVL